MIRTKFSFSIFFLLLYSVVFGAYASQTDSLRTMLEKAKGAERVKLLNFSAFNCRFSDADFAMHSGLEGLALYKGQKADTLSTYLHLNVGLLYYDIGKYDKALEHFIEAEKQAESFHDSKDMGSAMQNIGMVYQTQTFYEKALINYSAALKKFEEAEDKGSVGSVYTSLGALYYELEDNEKALEYFIKALKISEELHNSKGIADGLNNVAVIYEEMNNFTKAMEYHKLSLQLSRNQSNMRSVSSSLYNIALIYQGQKEYDNAIKYIDSAMIVAKQVNAPELLKEYYRTLSEIYSMKGDYRTALDHFVLFSEMKDTLVNKDRNKLIVEMSTKYQTDKKEQENKLLKLQGERQRIVNYTVTVWLILVVVFSFYMWKSYRQKRKANILLESQNTEIKKQKSVIEEKNKDITDSIRYAKRLQSAILKPQENLDSYFNEGFILFRPKDIVSGDFYWFEKFGNLSLVAAADCTGHGVPGAFMSIIGCNLLSQAVNEYAITQPAAILNSLNKGLSKVLQQKQEAVSVQDGMDITLCVFDPEKMVVQYAGAYNPLWLVRDGQLIEYKADKFPVGAFVGGEPKKFTNHDISVRKGDVLYMFSDGFADQFGGPHGKKFKYKQFQKVLCDNYSKPMMIQKNILDQEFVNWTGDLAQVDDVLIIGIRI